MQSLYSFYSIFCKRLGFIVLKWVRYDMLHMYPLFKQIAQVTIICYIGQSTLNFYIFFLVKDLFQLFTLMWKLQNLSDKSLQLVAENYPELQLLNLTRQETLRIIISSREKFICEKLKYFICLCVTLTTGNHTNDFSTVWFPGYDLSEN